MMFHIKISSNLVKSQNSPFLAILSDTLQKKIQKILNRTILTLDALPIAHFEAYVPIFLKHMLTLPITLKFWVPAQSEVG